MTNQFQRKTIEGHFWFTFPTSSFGLQERERQQFTTHTKATEVAPGPRWKCNYKITLRRNSNDDSAEWSIMAVCPSERHDGWRNVEKYLELHEQWKERSTRNKTRSSWADERLPTAIHTWLVIWFAILIGARGTGHQIKPRTRKLLCPPKKDFHGFWGQILLPQLGLQKRNSQDESATEKIRISLWKF